MKYLKSYHIFENKESDLSSDIEDVFLELKDIGFNVIVKTPPTRWIIQIEKETGFNWTSQIENVFERIKEYLQSKDCVLVGIGLGQRYAFGDIISFLGEEYEEFLYVVRSRFDEGDDLCKISYHFEPNS